MKDKKIVMEFTVLTFCIAYLVAGCLIFLGQYGYSVYNWVTSIQQFLFNVPFAVYILSPAIASYIVLKKNKKVLTLKEWLRTVFYAKNSLAKYLFVIAGLAFYFLIHMVVTGSWQIVQPFYTFFLSLPGNLIIGGLEEAGWMYVLQPRVEKKYGFIKASLIVGVIWIFWHVPLFFIPGTNHGEGLINFWMFSVQLIAFRFFNGAIYKISGKGCVFMCVLFHTMFNAISPIFGNMTMNWSGTIVANTAMIILSIVTVSVHDKKNRDIE